MKYRVLFLCAKNSARSQMAEAILKNKADDKFAAFSAGSHPAEQIHPIALEVLTHAGYDMTGKHPKSMDNYAGENFDFIITLCDSMNESCPLFTGQPIYAHWGMPDPAEFTGTNEQKSRFFTKTLLEITHRIQLFISLPIEKLDRLALEMKVKEIGNSIEKM